MDRSPACWTDNLVGCSWTYTSEAWGVLMYSPGEGSRVMPLGPVVWLFGARWGCVWR
jgi:hypothetical protein